MFANEAEKLAQEFWNIYLQKRDKDAVDKIMSMCSDKFIIMGMKDAGTATNKAQFKAEMERAFSRRQVALEISEQKLQTVPTGRNSCVVFGDVSVSGTLHGSTYFYTYGFTMAVRKEKEDDVINYLHCWRMKKSDGENDNTTNSGKREWHGVNMYQRALEGTRDIVFGIDLVTDVVVCEDLRVKQLLGVGRKIDTFDALRQLAKDTVHPDDIDHLDAGLDGYIQRIANSPCGEVYTSRACRIRFLKEGYIWCKIEISPVRQGNEPVRRVVSYVRDINRFKEKAQYIRHQAKLDPLTGCDNAIGAREKIDEFMASMNPGGILLLFDINELKWINQNAGYEIGDQVLFDFAAILKRYVREDDVIARIDSDDFVIYIKGTRSKESLKRTITEIFEEFADYIYNRELDEQIRCFATAAWYGEDGTGFDELYEKAQSRMTRIKRRGKRNYMF